MWVLAVGLRIIWALFVTQVRIKCRLIEWHIGHLDCSRFELGPRLVWLLLELRVAQRQAVAMHLDALLTAVSGLAVALTHHPIGLVEFNEGLLAVLCRFEWSFNSGLHSSLV